LLVVLHRRQAHFGPPQVAVLQDVIGFGCRAEDFVGDGEQQRPQQHEAFGVFVGGGHGTVTASELSRCARLPPLSQRYQPGLAASLRRPHTVPLQTASLTDAANRPPTNRFNGVSSRWASWTV